MITDWIDSALSGPDRAKADFMLNYGALHGPTWLEIGYRPRLRISVGTVVLAVLPPVVAGGALGVIIGQVIIDNGDGSFGLTPLAGRGLVAGHHGDDWTPEKDGVAVNDSGIYAIVEPFSEAGRVDY